MPISQSYKINTGVGYEGQIFGLMQHMYVRTVEAGEANMKFGTPVKAKPNTERGVQAATKSTKNELCYGILVRQVNHEAQNRPSTDGNMAINTGSLLGMMVEGEIYVKLAAAVTRDATMSYDPATGWKATANEKYSNVVALKAGAAGEIIPVRIYSAPINVA